MPVLLLKSLLSLALLPLALIAAFTMLELFGKEERRLRPETLKKLHRANGIAYIALFAAIGFLCLQFLVSVKAEPPPRVALHAAVALSIAAILALKIAFVRYYRKFYTQAKALGFVAASLTVVLFGLSGGYFLLVTELGTASVAKAPRATTEVLSSGARTDAGSIARGKALYGEKCTPCHDPYSTERIVGPGHKGILKNPTLPASGRPSVPENIRHQLRDPYRDMPPFEFLSDEEVEDIVAFLNTL